MRKLLLRPSAASPSAAALTSAASPSAAALTSAASPSAAALTSAAVLHLAVLLSMAFPGICASAQPIEPVKWKVEAKKVNSDSKEVNADCYEIHAVGSISPSSWHIYDLNEYAGGPNGTVFDVSGEGVSKVGEPYVVSKVSRKFDEIFGMEIGTCSSPVELCQKIRLTSGGKTDINVLISWQACNDESCLPPAEHEETLSVSPEETGASSGKSLSVSPEETGASSGKSLSVSPESPGNSAESPGTSAESPGTSAGKSLWGLVLEAIAWGFVALLTPCVFPMIPMTVSFFLKQGEGAEEKQRGEDKGAEERDEGAEEKQRGEDKGAEKKQRGEGNKKRNRGKWLAGIFGLSIVALYTLPIFLIISVTYLTGGSAVTADIFNWLATHWIPNLIFFLIFMVFAASFFGAFEITMPGALVNKSDRNSEKGGLAGVFFVALTLVLVSFSCTGPIVGSVLIKSTHGEFWEPVITMLAFSIAFALPFTVFAFAPSLLKKLPKSGGWLNSVKVVLGFIELALGFKFLSVADQTYHWGILDREVYLAIWIVVFTLLGFYLLGKIRFAHDTEVKHISVFRLMLVIVDFTFVVYMIPGMWGAPLKALSGYLPPITSQDFVIEQRTEFEGIGGFPQGSGPQGCEAGITGGGPQGCEAGTTGGGPQGGSSQGCSSQSFNAGRTGRKYSDFLKLPYNIPAFFDYEEAIAYAREVGKPVFIDFTGHGCVNCREMESRVWSDPRALKMLREEYVVCALYADDKAIVSQEDWVTTDNGKTLKTLGKINSHFALTRFNVNAQPYYAILNPFSEDMKVPSRGYDLNVEAFVAFLRKGLE